MNFLKKGDRIDIIAPSRFISQGPLEAYFDFLNAWGLVPYLHDNTLGEDTFYANGQEARLKAVRAAIESPDSKALWCIQGGYGATHVLGALPPLHPPFPKIVMGFSDCTSLLWYAHKHWSWTAIHGPTLNKLVFDANDSHTLKTVQELLLGHTSTIEYGVLTPLNQAAIDSPCVTGKALGGNMSLVQRSINTSWWVDLEESILFLEDIHENPFRILERLQHFKNAGLLGSIKAIVFFDFTVEEAEEELLTQALERIGQETSVPVFKGQGIGHGVRNLPVVLGQSFCIKDGHLYQHLS